MQKQLSRFLFCYQSTPHSTTGLSPAEMLMGRRLCTHLDLMRPDVSNRVRTKQGCQKSLHDRHARERQFEVGDSVFARNFGTGQKWLAGTVVTVKGQSCTVELADGRNIRRHLDHICPCPVLHFSSAVSNNELLEVPMTADHSAEEVKTTELPATEAVQEPRRSTRVRRLPDRFDFSYY